MVVKMKASLAQQPVLQRILSHESVYPTASDDATENNQDFATYFLTSPEYTVIIPDRDAALLFRQQNLVCFEMHAAFISGHARKRIKEYSVAALKWLFENTRAESIISMIPAYHEPSLIYAKVGGMIERCRLTNAFQKGGKLHELVVLDMSKERFYTLHGGE